MKLCLVTKSSKYEWEKKKFGLSHDELMAKYDREHANVSVIMESHERQELAKLALLAALKVTPFTLDDFRDTLFRACFDDGPWIDSRPDMIIVLGGDNTVTAVMQKCSGVPVMAVNSDPKLSTGCLTRWRADDKKHIAEIKSAIDGGYRTEDWTRLEVDGHRLAISEVFVGETKRNDMSRHILEYRGKSYEQKSSGLIVSTGCGSTGWYNAVNWHRTLDENKFHPTSPYAKFVVTEPCRYNSDSSLREGELLQGETITLHSLNDSGGIVSMDTWTEEPFVRGDSISIRIGQPAKVVVPMV